MNIVDKHMRNFRRDMENLKKQMKILEWKNINLLKLLNSYNRKSRLDNADKSANLKINQ